MKKLLAVVLLCMCSVALSSGQKPIPIDQAFAFSADVFGKDTIVAHWQIAPKHYLYKDHIRFKLLKPENASIGTIIKPVGQIKEDQIFGKYSIYKNKANISIPIINPDLNETVLQVSYQGCSENGYCYPPVKTNLQVNFNEGKVVIGEANAPAAVEEPSEQDRVSRLLKSGHLTTIILSFLGFGILLAFTPCVLPMIPILSGIIVGKKESMSAGKIFRLSLVYVLSMSLTYAIAGVLVGYAGG